MPPIATTSDDALREFQFNDVLEADDPRYVDLSPLRGARGSLAKSLSRAISAASASKPYRGLLVGHRGTGKSSEMRRAALALESIAYVDLVDAGLRLDVDDVRLEDLVLVLLQSVLQLASDNGLPLPGSELEVFRRWGETLEVTEVLTRDGSVEAEAGVDTTGPGALLGLVLGLVGRFTSRLTVGSTNRKEVRRVVEPRLPELLAAAEGISVAAMAEAQARGRGIVVLLDGLDQMRFRTPGDAGPSPYEVLLSLQAPEIQRVAVHLVLNAPIGLQVQGRADHAWRVIHLSNVAVAGRDGKPRPDVIRAFAQVIRNRADVQRLFEGGEAAAERVAAWSGGNVRDALRIVLNAAEESFAARIGDDALEHAARAYGASLWARTTSDEERAWLTRLGSERADLTGDALIQRLLQTGIVLAYQNTEAWVALHPCVALARGHGR
jgi:hypothetical protein